MLWSSLNVLYPFSVIFGQFWAADLCSRFGRKPTAIFGSLLYLPGILLSYFSKTLDSWELLFIGRLIWFVIARDAMTCEAGSREL